MLLFDDSRYREQFFPLTLTRQTADLRVGIFTLREKWQLRPTSMVGTLEVGDLVPGREFIELVAAGRVQEAMERPELYRRLRRPWDLNSINDWAIQQDLEMVRTLRKSLPVSGTNRITGPEEDIFIEEGARVEHAYLNTEGGPIYVGPQALVMEGAMLRGPVSIGSGAIVKMGAAIYGATTLGPGCVIGGEVKNSIFHEYSNKAHDGYIGDAVIGSWCNLGAGTTCSNVRNNAGTVKAWSMAEGMFVEVGLKCGLIMGDHSRAAINTAFNTATVVGVSANIFGGDGLTPKFIPSFSWGYEARYMIDNAIRDINNWMGFKKMALSRQEIDTLKQIHSNHSL